LEDAGMARPIAAFSNSYARMPAHFFASQIPASVAQPHMVKFNAALAEELGLDGRAIEAAGPAGLFAGNIVPDGAEPIAMAYAGHQFGNFVPQLGDGRAILLGEVIDRNGVRRDIQFKGAGRTPFSRGGDGRAALGPVLREYLVSEAMHALGIPATRALAAVTTGEIVLRETGLPGAVLTRVAASHIRVGTFQYFAARGDVPAVQQLADYVIDRHYPDARDAENPYLALLDAVLERQAFLIARWMQVGFIHGVMNTDNMAISGETIDFGPCAFMDTYDPATVFSAIDQFGRYAYANQPRIAQWNLARFAETLLPLIDADQDRSVARASEMISGFSARFERYWLAGMREKLGLRGAEDGDAALIGTLLETMHKNAADFTLTFRRLCDAALSPENDAGLQALFAEPGAFNAWAGTWRSRLDREPYDPQARADAMRRVNPVFIPRNHRVEHALAMAVEQSDFGAFEELLEVLSRPYEEQPAMASYADAPAPSERVFRTYCGT
jgi:serine/tyrosine/threonine adenylyltransferase